MNTNGKRVFGASMIVLLIFTFGTLKEAEGATSQSTQISSLQKQLKKLQSQVGELQDQLEISQTDLEQLQYRVSAAETNASLANRLASYSESAITYLHVNQELGGTRCPSGSFGDFIGLGSVQIPYRSYLDSAGSYRNSLDVIRCTVTVLTKKP